MKRFISKKEIKVEVTEVGCGSYFHVYKVSEWENGNLRQIFLTEEGAKEYIGKETDTYYITKEICWID